MSNEFNEWSRSNILRNCGFFKTRGSPDLLKFLLQLIYKRSVLEPRKLNRYEAFSPNVYGEASVDAIERILKRLANCVDKSDTFIDLGSGVGNVVLQVAASVECKMCYGFEKAEWPAFFAQVKKNFTIFWLTYKV